MDPAPRPIGVEAREIRKAFGGAQALRGVSVVVRPGTVHALIGENGAGKSTLGKAIAGAVRPDSGTLLIDGERAEFRSPRDALARGVTLIAQELALEPRRSVLDNVYLGIERPGFGLIDRGALRARYRELTASVGFEVPPGTLVGSLRVADQQKVEILRALARRARIIVMDEPTAALTGSEAAHLTDIVRTLRSQGTTIVYVSHFLEEVLRVADDITVLRNGEVVQTVAASETEKPSLVSAMLGRESDLAYPPKQYPKRDSPFVLRAEGIGRRGVLEGVDLEVREGEILGIAGLVGSGRSELARVLYGADRHDTGRLRLRDRDYKPRHPRDAVRQGIGMIPESRKDQGLLMRRSVLENLTLAQVRAFARATGLIDGRRERVAAMSVAQATDVRTPNLGVPVGTLSGGNQQKVLFARWLIRPPQLLIADEPTRGVDVGAKLAIYELIVSMAAAGSGVIVISSEIEEVLGLAHNVIVLNAGSVVGRFAGPSFSLPAVMHAAFTVPTRGAA